MDLIVFCLCSCLPTPKVVVLLWYSSVGAFTGLASVKVKEAWLISSQNDLLVLVLLCVLCCWIDVYIESVSTLVFGFACVSAGENVLFSSK